jgi:hypothetical protein
MHAEKMGRVYVREMGGAMLVYAVILIATIKYGRTMAEGVARTAILVSPMLGFGLAVWAIARHLRRVDEYIRQFTLETVSIAAAITAGLSFTYGFLETAGFPLLSMFYVWPVMGAVWGVVGLVRAWRNR